MGYTHYFTQHRHATPEEWAAITNDFKKLRVAALLTQAFPPIQREWDRNDEVEITNEQIIFNGVGDDGHETMLLSRCGEDFQFCKTARKPYDRAVVALLILANHHALTAWQIGSDGDADDWGSTLRWMNTLNMGDFMLPSGI